MITKRWWRAGVTAVAMLLVTLLAACSSGSPEVTRGGGAPNPQATQGGAPGDASGPENAPDGERLIIRTQTLRVEVSNTAESVEALRGLADRHESIVSSMRVASDDSWIYDSPGSRGTALRGWVTVRVPADQLEAFTKGVIALGELLFQEETSDDVTQEHVDLSARLENLRAQEARLRELVAEAANVEDTLAVEKELWRIRGEIESLDAQVKYLERQAAMATVTVEFTEDKPIVRNWGFLSALEDGVRAAAGVLAFLITFLIASLPVVVLGLIALFVVRAIRRRRPAADSAAAQPAGGRKRRRPRTEQAGGASVVDAAPPTVQSPQTTPKADES